MPVYGTQIGKKFAKDGSALPYPGNTVISDVCPGNPAYDVMSACRALLLSSPLAGRFIPLPASSYHTTIIRGVNDLVRTPEYWPAHKPQDTPFESMDKWFEQAIASVPNPGPIAMRFEAARITEEDFRIALVPADEAQNAVLRRYRDDVAAALGLYLPGHAGYTFHITLAYTLTLPESDEEHALEAIRAQMGALLCAQGPFSVDPPHAAFYRDMLEFYPHRIDRT